MAIYSDRIKRAGGNLYARTLTSAPARVVVDRCTVDTAELRSIAERRGEFYELDTADTVTFDPPTSPDGVPRPLEWHVGEHAVDDSFVASLQECQLLGPKALTAHSGRRYIFENSLRSQQLLGRAFIASLRAGVVPTPRRTGGRSSELAVSLVGPWCRGYFHWFAEWLPRLAGVVRFTAETGRSPTVIVPSNPPEWLRESLRLVGFNEYTTWGGGRTAVGELVVPSLRRAHPVDAPEEYTNTIDGYRWVRRRILNRITSDAPLATERVYITRRRADDRHVLNETALLDSLTDYGFEAYELETMSFTEQVRLFEGADVVVGPHGAGLVNLIYGTDLTVIELFGDYINGCYYTLSDGLGFNYGFLRCQPVGADMRVDVDRLEMLLNQML